MKLVFKSQLQTTSLSLYTRFEIDTSSNSKFVDVSEYKCTKAHGKNHIKVRPLLVHHFLHYRLSTVVAVLGGCTNAERQMILKTFTVTCYNKTVVAISLHKFFF